jgi:hypothetical protein
MQPWKLFRFEKADLSLAKLFRGLLLELVRQERPDLIIPEVVWTKGWVVSGKPAVQGTENVLISLGR